MDKKLLWGSIIATTVGLLDSIYMTVYKLTDNNAMCLGSGDCATVNASKYSEIYGIPVAVVGIIAYLAILGVHYLENRFAFFEQNGTLLIFGMGLTGVLYSAYLTYLEFYVIRAVCPFCIVSAIAITAVFLIAIVRLIRQPVN